MSALRELNEGANTRGLPSQNFFWEARFSSGSLHNLV